MHVGVKLVPVNIINYRFIEMSLRFRLNLFITLLFILIFIGCSFYIIDNARKSVISEVRSSARFSLQLITIALNRSTDNYSIESQTQVLEKIASLENIRHLEIEIYRANNPFQTKQKISSSHALTTLPRAPEWFVRLVQPPLMEFKNVVKESNTEFIEIIVRANPADEITEVWNETKGVLILLVIFVVLANILVYVMLGRGLSPVETILRGLEGIEHGEYDLRLPEFNLPELSRISGKFNLMAEVLQNSKEENRFLTKKSLAIQESERRNLAYELHDELGQSITAIKAVAASLDQEKDSNSAVVKERARAIIDVSNRMYDVARAMMRRLRPPALDELGLITTLQDMIDDWNSTHEDLFCSFHFYGNAAGLSDEINISIYRIIQECLTNVVKHANASSVNITLATGINSEDDSGSDSNNVILEIEDDGRGFDPGTTRPGMGFLGMRERVESLHGELEFITRPGAGVKVVITIPVDKHENE